MNISASLSSAIAELASPMPSPVASAPAMETPAAVAVSSSSSLVMSVADKAVTEDTSGLVDVFA